MPDATKIAEPSDVVMLYRLFLRREPENEAVIALHLSDRPTLSRLMQRFAESKEYEPVRIDDGCSGIWRRQDGRSVEVEASAEAKAEILAHVERIWSAYGTDDPYFSVLTNPAYHANNMTTELTEKFYESGANGLSDLKLSFERNRIKINPSWHILDFGCGVGRIGEHFCREFEYYYGVDISANHLARARSRFAGKSIANARLLHLMEALQNDISFDVFYSVIVLQHNPPPIMYHLLDVFLRKLRPNGYAFFQLPCHLYRYNFDADRYLTGQGKHDDGMEMHALPQKYVFEVLQRHGLRPIEVCPFPVIGPIGISYVFFAHKAGRIETGDENRAVA